MVKLLYVLFSITLLIFIATTAFAAELGAGKALKADKGPTLEETLQFIKMKGGEFILSSFKIKHWFDKSCGDQPCICDEVHAITKVNYDKCTFRYNKLLNLDANCSNPFWNVEDHSHDYVIDLSKVQNIKTELVTRGIEPVWFLYIYGSKDEILADFPMKSKDYATRFSNAFERAVQLCGGGKDIGKEELF